MTGENKADDQSNSTEELAATIQEGQNIIENVEDDVPAEALQELEAVEDGVERLEDGIEDGDDTLPGGFEEDVQSAQDAIGGLQETLNVSGADRALLVKIEELEDIVETIEDRAADVHDRYGVKVGNHPVEFFDEESPTAEEILTRFGEDPDDALVEKGTENTYSGDDPVPLGGPGIERFTSEPRTPGNS